MGGEVRIFAILFFLLFGQAHAATHLQDNVGRALFLKGINLGSKSSPYLPWQDKSELQALKDSGINFVRLYIQWSQIEPSPLQYNQSYLDDIKDWIRLAHQYDLMVLVDLHQDGYGQAVGGNGAPDWATRPREIGSLIPRIGMPWFFIYFDKAVMTSFDAFWENEIFPETEIGLSDHYALAWKWIAKNLRSEPNVIGYDLFNEPFYGSLMKELLSSVIANNFWFLVKNSLLAVFKGEDITQRFIDAIRDEKQLYQLLKSVEPKIQKFEKNTLMPFYEKVAQSIRQEDSLKTIFIEPSLFKGMGSHNYLKVLLDEKGLPISNVAYAPHYYDPTTIDGAQYYDLNKARIKKALEISMSEANTAGYPLLLGEWGNFAVPLDGASESIADHQDLFLQNFISSSYWDFGTEFLNSTYLDSLNQPYTQKLEGIPLAQSWDPLTNAFELEYEVKTKNYYSTMIYWPKRFVQRSLQIETNLDPTKYFYFYEKNDQILYFWALDSNARVNIRLTSN